MSLLIFRQTSGTPRRREVDILVLDVLGPLPSRIGARDDSGLPLTMVWASATTGPEELEGGHLRCSTR